MKILCIIPARSGSKGIKNKNIINVNGFPMLVWSIKQAKASIPNLDMESGGSMAISTVKQSPFFTEYANTAQFS